MRGCHLGALAVALTCLTAEACVTGRDAASDLQKAPIVQPGAPGEPGRVITAQEAAAVPRVQHTAADVRFMHGMIAHHTQAVEMTALRADRSTSEDLRLMALRIELSQVDEIQAMQEWLKRRGEPLPDPHAHHGDHAALMPGMLTAEEMSRLARAKGAEFDRLFLELM